MISDHSYPLTLTLIILALGLPCIVLGTLALQWIFDMTNTLIRGNRCR